MLRTLKARKLLTKKEQEHLSKVANIHTMAGMKRQIKFMQELEKKHPDDHYYSMMNQCYECYTIGKKLGLIGE